MGLKSATERASDYAQLIRRLHLAGRRRSAADDGGNIYALTGNGNFDGITDFGNSFLKFTGAAATLAAWFTPPNWQMLADDDVRRGGGSGDHTRGPLVSWRR